MEACRCHPTSDIRHPTFDIRDPTFDLSGHWSNWQTSIIKMVDSMVEMSESMADGSPGKVHSDTQKLCFLKSFGFLKQRGRNHPLCIK